MSVVKIIKLVGESKKGWQDALDNCIKEAQKTLRGITRIGVMEMDVRMANDKVDVYRVKCEVSFRLER
jgi:flavin-binding protein dodecin